MHNSSVFRHFKNVSKEGASLMLTRRLPHSISAAIEMQIFLISAFLDLPNMWEIPLCSAELIGSVLVGLGISVHLQVPNHQGLLD